MANPFIEIDVVVGDFCASARVLLANFPEPAARFCHAGESLRRM
jgi:hypothetical protein